MFVAATRASVCSDCEFDLTTSHIAVTNVALSQALATANSRQELNEYKK